MPTEREALRAALNENPEQAEKLLDMVRSGKLVGCDELPPGPIAVVAAPDHNGIVGARQYRCECGALVWLGPSTQGMLARRGNMDGVRLICIECAMKDIHRAKE